MENKQWLQDIHCADTKAPASDLKGETVYTLYQKDFLQMPAVDFSVLIEIDPDLRSLLN